jgi:hypothetical protein
MDPPQGWLSPTLTDISGNDGQASRGRAGMGHDSPSSSKGLGGGLAVGATRKEVPMPPWRLYRSARRCQRPRNRRGQWSWAPLSLLVCLLAACSPRLGQFQALGEAGVAYTNAMGPLLEQAGSAAINSNSLRLLEFRQQPVNCSSRDALRHKLDEYDGLMQQRLQLLGELRGHTRLLNAYFVFLLQLAQSDTPAQASKASQGIVKHMLAAGQRLGQDPQVQKLLPGIVGTASKFIVQGIQVKMLEEELSARGETVYRQILLHQAAVQAVGDMLKTDSQILFENLRYKARTDFYDTECRVLPEAWPQRRLQYLSAPPTDASAPAAHKAAKNLAEAFRDLARGEVSSQSLPQVLSETDEVLSWLRALRQISGAD